MRKTKTSWLVILSVIASVLAVIACAVLLNWFADKPIVQIPRRYRELVLYCTTPIEIVMIISSLIISIKCVVSTAKTGGKGKTFGLIGIGTSMLLILVWLCLGLFVILFSGPYETPPTMNPNVHIVNEQSVTGSVVYTESDVSFEPNYSNPNLSGDDFYPGNYISYGCFCGEALIWQVLEVDDNRALLFLNNVLMGSDGRPYRIVFSHDDEYITWENSYIRTWLNNDFYNNAFGEDNAAILLTSIPNEGSEEHYLSFDDTIQETYYIDYQSEGGEDTNDYIYLLSQNEIIDYFDGVENINGSTWTFYLRTPACNNHSVLIADVPANDFGPTPVLSAGDGIRPAMWVDINYWR